MGLKPDLLADVLPPGLAITVDVCFYAVEK